MCNDRNLIFRITTNYSNNERVFVYFFFDPEPDLLFKPFVVILNNDVVGVFLQNFTLKLFDISENKLKYIPGDTS